MPSSRVISRPRVAIADDDLDSRSLLADCLRDAGFHVTTATDGTELLALLEGAVPGFFRLVITDQRMPGLTGVECLRLAGRRAPFLIVSGEDDPGFLAAADELGAVEVMRKPADLRRLLVTANRIARRGEHVLEPQRELIDGLG